MGTRSLTYVYGGDRETKPLMCLYRQYDGYPAGHGQELIDFLKPIRLVNGLGSDNKQKVANGMGCLAAQLVANFKDGPGQFYLYEPELGQDACQEYEYHIFDREIEVKDGYGKTIFAGDYEEFQSFCKEDE
jgi:hypothetical protein